MLISFIIPIYNRESILPEAINSILQSEMDDYEIILIDDGSSDKSSELCAQYEKTYSFVHFIAQKENQGTGTARNKGIEAAKGEWLFFLDSDDLICTENLLSVAIKLRHLSSKVDIVAINYIDEYKGSCWRYPDLKKEEELEAHEFIKKYPFRVYVPAWCAFFRNSFVNKYQIRYPVGTWLEDATFVLDALSNAKRIAVIPEFFYYYRVCRIINPAVHYSKTARSFQSGEAFFKKICEKIIYYTECGELDIAEILKKRLEYVSCTTAIGVLSKKNIIEFSNEEFQSIYTPQQIVNDGLYDYCIKVFSYVFSKFQCKECYLAPAGPMNRILADYLMKKGCNVLGFFDNGTVNGTTPSGLNLPVYPREKCKDICGHKMILVTSASLVGDKLQKYYEEQGVFVARLCSRDFELYKDSENHSL